jgi:hypothetical protein
VLQTNPRSTFTLVTDPGTETLRRIAAAALPQLDALAETLVATIRAELPELVRDPRTGELFEATVLDNVMSALRALGTGTGDDAEYVAPPIALEFARRLAQQGVPITTMLRAYRLGQAALVQFVFALIAAEKLSAEEVAAASTALSSFGFEFIDIVSEQVVAAYQVERDAWLRNRNATRLAKVQAVLTGAVGEPGEVEKALGFSLSRPFVGVVAWSDQDAGEADRLGRLEKQLAELAAALGAQPRAVLSVAPDDSTLWAWIPAASVDAAAVRSKLTASVRAAIGDPAAGLAGFRSTHQQARQAQALAVAAGEPQPLLASAELGPLALVATEVDGVRGWVQKVLGDLAADDENCARLRETVWAYLSSGSSLNTAAAELHVHKNTVQYRVGKAEEIRGRPLEDGRIDVEVALLACRLLGSTVLASPPT